jgi:signal transduction histidine kinase
LGGGFAALLLLALASTLPLAFVLGSGAPRRGTAVALSTACVLSLVPFGILTVGGVVAQLVCVYVLGRAGRHPLGGLLVLPYVVIALGSHEEPTRIVAVLVATLASAAAATGIAHHVRSTAQAHSATEQAFADTLLEHAARGERARIARELHDVVAHHISMIAVQAETARLTTPGLPAEGATRLLAIGDTARTALTEMRRLLGVLREDADTGVQRRPQPGLAPAHRAGRRVTGRGRFPYPAHRQRPVTRSTPASRSPRTASSRRPSPTPAGTRRAPPWT